MTLIGGILMFRYKNKIKIKEKDESEDSYQVEILRSPVGR